MTSSSRYHRKLTFSTFLPAAKAAVAKAEQEKKALEALAAEAVEVCGLCHAFVCNAAHFTFLHSVRLCHDFISVM
jgi:hypothetical protein